MRSIERAPLCDEPLSTTPEHPPRRGIGFGGHDLGDEFLEGFDAGLGGDLGRAPGRGGRRRRRSRPGCRRGGTRTPPVGYSPARSGRLSAAAPRQGLQAPFLVGTTNTWSIGPCTPAKKSRRAAGSVASKAAVRCAPTSAAARASRSGLRPVRMTSAPSARARRAVSRPMPAEPPMQTTVCPREVCPTKFGDRAPGAQSEFMLVSWPGLNR